MFDLFLFFFGFFMNEMNEKIKNLANFFKLDGLGKRTFRQNGNSNHVPLGRGA
jgi:hypothetical protein